MKYNISKKFPTHFLDVVQDAGKDDVDLLSHWLVIVFAKAPVPDGVPDAVSVEVGLVLTGRELALPVLIS